VLPRRIIYFTVESLCIIIFLTGVNRSIGHELHTSHHFTSRYEDKRFWAELTKPTLRLCVVEWFTPLLRIREVPGSNISSETCYLKVLRGFPQPRQANNSAAQSQHKKNNVHIFHADSHRNILYNLCHPCVLDAQTI
jgi:hypothetical protein